MAPLVSVSTTVSSTLASSSSSNDVSSGSRIPQLLSVTDSPGASPSPSNSSILAMPKILVAVIGGSVGFLLLFLLVVAIVYWRRRRKQVRKSQLNAFASMSFVSATARPPRSDSHMSENTRVDGLHMRNPRSPIMIETRPREEINVKGAMDLEEKAARSDGVYFISLSGMQSPQRPKPIFDLKHPKR